MADNDAPRVGTIAWTDLTIGDAERLSAFYSEVVGWEASAVDMGGYNDFNMNHAPGQAAAGICHARGVNADVPPQWLIYIAVDDIDRSIERCRELGGQVIHGPRSMGDSRFCVIQDPAGAVAALISRTSS